MIDNKKETLRLSKRLLENILATQEFETKEELMDFAQTLYEHSTIEEDDKLIVEAYAMLVKTIELLSVEEIEEIKANLTNK